MVDQSSFERGRSLTRDDFCSSKGNFYSNQLADSGLRDSLVYRKPDRRTYGRTYVHIYVHIIGARCGESRLGARLVCLLRETAAALPKKYDRPLAGG